MEEKINIFALTKQDTAVLKGIAIVAMLMHHLWGCAPSWVDPYTGVLGFLGSVGKVCVAIFLFCSGYGLSVGYSKVMENCRLQGGDWRNGIKATLKFLAKRFVRFYAGYWPIFLIFVPLSVFVFGRGFDIAYGANYNWSWITKDFLCTPGAPSYNITWWFNKLIVLFYLCFPILFFISKKWSIISLMMSVIIMRFAGHIPNEVWKDFAYYVFPFVLGVVLYVKQTKLSSLSEWVLNHLWSSLVLSFIIFGVALYLRVTELIPHFSGGIRWDGFLTSAIVLFYVCIRRGIFVKSGTLTFLGKHSMNTYLTHTFFFAMWFPAFFYSRELGGG